MKPGPLYAPVTVAANSTVGAYCLLGCPKEERLRAEREAPGSAGAGEPVVVGERCLIFNQVVVYELRRPLDNPRRTSSADHLGGASPQLNCSWNRGAKPV